MVLIRTVCGLALKSVFFEYVYVLYSLEGRRELFFLVKKSDPNQRIHIWGIRPRIAALLLYGTNVCWLNGAIENDSVAYLMFLIFYSYMTVFGMGKL